MNTLNTEHLGNVLFYLVFVWRLAECWMLPPLELALDGVPILRGVDGCPPE